MMKRSFALVALSLVLSATTASAQSFFESFETGPADFTGATNNNPPPGNFYALSSGNWFALNNSVPIGTTGVFQQSTVFPAFDGTFYAAMNFNNVAGANTIDTWFMTPVVTIQNGDTFSFVTRTVDSPAFPDRLSFGYSTNGASTNPADFTNQVQTINAGLTTAGYPNTWTLFTINVSGLGGPVTGRFGFNYNVTNGGPSGANSDFIGIDAVTFTSSAVPEPTTWALLGLGACSALPAYRRWRKSRKAVAKAGRVFARK